MIKNLIHSVFKKLSKKITSLDSNLYDLDLLIKKLYPVETNFELIRIGSENDGGYLIPNDLENIEICFSPGTSDNCSFELDLAENYGITSYMCDWSVNNSPIIHNKLNFLKKYLGVINDNKYIRLENWFESIMPQKECILQMDIEGSEYNVILDTKDEILSKFRIIIIEFHNLDMLFNEFSNKIISAVFEKILNNFRVVHIHPNNCSPSFKYKGIEIPPVMEFTFLNINRIDSFERSSKFPHKLDSDNTDKKTIKLPGNWYTKTSGKT